MYYLILIPNLFKFLKLKYVLAKVQKGWQSKQTVDFQEDKTKIESKNFWRNEKYDFFMISK